MMNHINSVKRPQFKGKSPNETAVENLGEDIFHKLELELINEKEVLLTKDLFKK